MGLCEKYRPKNWGELVGQDEIVESLTELIKRGEVPNLLFLGKSGTGKTSVAYLLARDLNSPILEFNASIDRGIDIVRGPIKRYAQTSGRRILFLDEADSMTNDAMQALRRIMETTKSSIFIITGNLEYKIITPIKSRCAIYRFKKLDNDIVLRKILEICKGEGIKVEEKDKEGLVELVKQADGDLRWAINTLETLITSDKEVSPKNIIMLQKPKMVGDAIQTALRGDFERAKEMLEDAYINQKSDLNQILDEIYNELEKVEDREVRIRLYTKFSDCEERCRRGNPIIHLTSFLAYCFIAPHLKKQVKEVIS